MSSQMSSTIETQRTGSPENGAPRAKPRRRLVLWLAAALTVVGVVGAATPAAAGGWGWGTSFRIGGVYFRIGHPAQYAGYHDHYYYRVDVPIRSRYRCTDRCFVQRSAHYHHRGCPVVRGYLRSHGYDDYRIFDRYAPLRYERGPYRYRSYDGYTPYWHRKRSREIERQRRRQWERERRWERQRRDRHRRYRDDDWRRGRRHRYDD